MRYKALAGLFFLWVVWQGAAPPNAFGGRQATAAVEPQTGMSQDEKNRRYFTDLDVISHEGEKLRFYSDLLKDKLVVISFFYTNCPTAQPPLITFFKLQKKLK